ncbi:hypothetical protein AMAG_08628 [Allomyces macrogynus ATCC 38327]|uniref:Uncharacterized protein n=1 Tax=Allomyces macrogynus (strain ATCC 38327) TaxID=578462 RepID=A0A0L0SLV5_ALLM3|nr:hypothetical protein AMAG_08628 [Allomyces macrogynus ATCC 38327]|eukprot:KNE63506.1 hypothetical protein AMAG_08628 [Allomyces macrogynus ATCC 38327]
MAPTSPSGTTTPSAPAATESRPPGTAAAPSILQPDPSVPPLPPLAAPLYHAATVPDRATFHGSDDMLSAYHLAPMYDLYFRPYMVPEGAPLAAKSVRKIDPTCDTVLDALFKTTVPPPSTALGAHRVLGPLLAPDYARARGATYAPPPTEVPAGAPEPWERLPPVQAPDREWFMAAIRDLRPGELQNVDLKSVGIDPEKPHGAARDAVVGRNGPQPVPQRPGAVVPSKRASPAPGAPGPSAAYPNAGPALSSYPAGSAGGPPRPGKKARTSGYYG